MVDCEHSVKIDQSTYHVVPAAGISIERQCFLVSNKRPRSKMFGSNIAFICGEWTRRDILVTPRGSLGKPHLGYVSPGGKFPDSMTCFLAEQQNGKESTSNGVDLPVLLLENFASLLCFYQHHDWHSTCLYFFFRSTTCFKCSLLHKCKNMPILVKKCGETANLIEKTQNRWWTKCRQLWSFLITSSCSFYSLLHYSSLFCSEWRRDRRSRKELKNPAFRKLPVVQMLSFWLLVSALMQHCTAS